MLSSYNRFKFGSRINIQDYMSHYFSSPPLQDFFLKSTLNVEEIHDCVSNVLTGHRVRTTSSSVHNNNSAILHHAPLPNSSFNYLCYGVETRIDVSQLGFFLVEIPLSGQSVTCCGTDTIVCGVGHAVIAGPYSQFSTVLSEDCSKLLIKIERNAFENCLSALLRRKQIRILNFEMGIDLGTDAGQSLLRTITWIVDELEHQGSLLNTRRLTRPNYEQALMLCLLNTQPHNYSEELERLALPVAPDFVVKTRTHIKENYANPIDLEELVGISGVSERLLLGGFRQHLGVSPMKYLRLVRLENAHLDLKELCPEKCHVTEIALSAGFTQLGKFSADYKRRFGESPSETLKTVSPGRSGAGSTDQ